MKRFAAFRRNFVLRHHAAPPSCHLAATRRDLRLIPFSASLAALLVLCTASAQAQISLTAAADMALRSNLKVKLAEDDVRKAEAGVAEARGVYVPSLSASSVAPGYSYGFPLGTPTIYTFTSTSIVYSSSQKEYVRASLDALNAAKLALKEAREGVLEDVSTTYLALNHDQQKLAAIGQELNYAEHLEAIVKDRLDAGQDTAMDYTNARRTRVKVQLAQMVVEDDLATDQDHFARLIGLAGTRVDTLPSGFPQTSLAAAANRATADQSSYDSAGVLSAFANARAKAATARGDNKFAFYPLITFGAEYAKFSTYNNQYTRYYPSVQGLTSQAAGFSLGLQIPLLDRARSERAKGATADALHAEHEAELDRNQQLEGRLKLSHGLRELGLRAELAGLDRDYAQEQLNVILTEMQSPPANGGPAITPKEAENARISERALFVDLVDQQYLLAQTEVRLLHQTGGLEDWLKSAESPDVSVRPLPAK